MKSVAYVTPSDPESGVVRTDSREDIVVQLKAQGESNLYEGLDGEQGVFVASYNYLKHPVETKVTVNITFPGNVTMKAKATVAWRKEGPGVEWPGVGLEFEGLSDKQTSILAAFKEQRSPLFY